MGSKETTNHELEVETTSNKLPSILYLALTLYSLSLVCGLILVVANILPDHVTLIAITTLVAHFFLSEILLNGLNGRRRRLMLPWFLITALEECLLALLFICLVVDVSDVNHVITSLTMTNVGVFVLVVGLTAARLAMWCKLFVTSLQLSNYDQL